MRLTERKSRYPKCDKYYTTKNGWVCTKLTEEKGTIIPINVPNSELDEKQELPPMTPEQFDEMYQEMEREK